MTRIRELDGLRAILAVWVVFVHVSKTCFETENRWFSSFLYNEGIRVRVFFMISGMVVMGMLIAKKTPYRPYIVGRLKRIYPAYAVCFLLAILTAPIAIHALQTMPVDLATNARRLRILNLSFDYWPAHIFAHLTMLHGVFPRNILPAAETAFLGQAWNISTEFQFYLVAPLLIWGATHSRLTQIATVAGASIATVLGFFYPNSANLGMAFGYFMLGTATFFLFRHAPNLLDEQWKRLTVAAFAISAAIVAASINPAVTIWLLFCLCVLPFYLGHTTRRPLAFLATAPMLWMGALSYSIYLSHTVVMYCLAAMLNNVGASGTGYFAYLLAGTVVGATALAWVIHRWVELPAGRIGQSDKIGAPVSA